MLCKYKFFMLIYLHNANRCVHLCMYVDFLFFMRIVAIFYGKIVQAVYLLYNVLLV